LTWLTFGSTNQTYSGVISGAGSFKKSGASVATLTLSGSNTYTGSTNVAAGTLIVTGDFGNTAITVAGAGATLSLQNANAVNQNSVTVGSGAASPGVLSETVVNSLGNSTALTVFTGGTATLSVANNYTGGTTLRDGVLLIGDNGALGLGTLALGKSGDSNLSPTIGSMDSNAHSVSNALSIAGTGPTLTFGATGGGTGALTFSYTGAVSLGGTNRTFAVNNTTTFAGGFTSASGAITKTGAGTMILSGTSNYTGATTISAGALVVTGSLSGTVSPSVAANSGFEVDGLINLSSTASVTGTLSGDGSLGAVTVNANGVFAPGLTSTVSASGSMTANGNVVLTNSSSVFSIRLGVASASDHDQLNIVGSSTVSLNGATLQIAVSPDYARQANNFVYVLINGGASGTGTAGNVFAEGSSITASNGDEFTILYDSNATGTGIGNDVVLELSSVPEPETWGTFLGGAGLLIAMRRNRRTRKI